ncbi:MAG: tetratricopeptide repeat protein, partial [Rubripirellula sp.]
MRGTMAWFRKGNCINAESNLGCERKSTSEIECSFANNLNAVTTMVMGWLILLTLAGCGEVAPSKPVSSSTALRTMKSSMRKGDWQAASESADQVIAAYHENASVIALVAQVRHENGDPELASQLLMQACRVDDYSVPARVNQAVVSLLAVGKLSEVFGFLEEALDHQPEQHEYRRLLYDLYMGTENRLLGIPHGRKLVLQRQFDLELLKNLSNTERRTQEVQPLKEILSRNAADKRPLIGSAKIEFDEGNYEGAIDLLLSIIEVHPDHIPSQAILGRAYAAARRFDELSVWAGKQSQPIAASPDYWIAIG